MLLIYLVTVPYKSQNVFLIYLVTVPYKSQNVFYYLNHKQFSAFQRWFYPTTENLPALTNLTLVLKTKTKQNKDKKSTFSFLTLKLSRSAFRS